MHHQIITRRTTTATTTAALLIAAVTAVATGCGPDKADTGSKSKDATARPGDGLAGMTAEQLDRRARDVTASATSMRVKGDVVIGGRSMEMDLALDRHGSCRGSITLGGGGTLDLIKKGDDLIYMKGDERFWRGSVAASQKGNPGRRVSPERVEKGIALFKNRWVKADRRMANGMGANLCNLKKMTGMLGDEATGGVTRGADTTEGGQPVAVLYQRKDDIVSTIHVAGKGKPYLVRITAEGGSAPGDLYFTEYGKPVDTTPPPADQILSPAEIAAQRA
ncbi:hypothetical protein [Streptomyces sp. NPDC090025]|uniref:hypothetical protein n=1 Tax=Streptomyces sp. NPDC090025 TaxID=3365922 RepID=UPI003838C230